MDYLATQLPTTQSPTSVAVADRPNGHEQHMYLGSSQVDGMVFDVYALRSGSVGVSLPYFRNESAIVRSPQQALSIPLPGISIRKGSSESRTAAAKRIQDVLLSQLHMRVPLEDIVSHLTLQENHRA